jgi:spore germination protein GerM
MTAATDRRRGRGLPVLVVLLLLATTAACGLSTNDEPEAIDDPQTEPVEAGADAPDLSTVDDTTTVHVWFVRTDEDGETHLVEAERFVPPPPTQRSVLEALIQSPPTDEERNEGTTTYIPEDVTIAEQPDLRSDGVLIVELSPDFYDLQGDTARYAFAQIVFTATGLPHVEMVQFERDGEPFNAVDGEGQSRAVPLTRKSYEELAPTGVEPA